jgi:Acetyltransferase (GNAT) domain
VQTVLSAVEPSSHATAVAPHEKWSICNPLEHRDWDTLLASHAQASVFHTRGWAQVLHETYGHAPFYFHRLAGSELSDLLPVMEVNSLLTGRRCVSLPFSDFCHPIISSRQTSAHLHDLAAQHGRERGWKYLDCRSDAPWSEGPEAPFSVSFHGHVIRPDAAEVLIEAFDGSVRRGIRKAETAGLTVELETSLQAMRTFYHFHCKTRKRHGLPPQPFRFFENIARYLLQPGKGFIATTFLKTKPIASLVFLHHGCQALYKFGASDHAFQHLRPNNLAMWKGIKHCAALGFVRLHLGRTSLANEGLRRFKLGFGASEETIGCRKFDLEKNMFVADLDRSHTWMNAVWRCLPLPVLRLAGHAIYQHLS